MGHQILHALLVLGDKYRIIAADANAFAFGLYEVDDRYILPLADDPGYVSALLALCESEGVAAILPGTQPEVRVLAANRETLASAGRVPIVNPSEVVKLCANKWRLYEWLTMEGIDTPKTVRADRWADLIREVGYPIVGKPTENTGASRGVAILKNEAEVDRYLAEVDANGTEVVFQEYVGEGDEEYTVGVLVTKTGDVIDSIVLKRNLVGLSLGERRTIGEHVYTLSTGYSQGFIIEHPPIRRYCEDLALKLGIRGPLNVQCRLAGGRVSVFEVHPRFSGSSSIRAEVGFNEPDVLIRNFLFSETFGRLDYQRNVAAIRAFRNMMVPMSVMEAVPKMAPGE